MAALSEVLNSVQKKNIASSSKQVKFASNPVMISSTSMTHTGGLHGAIDTSAILQSIPTASTVSPITSVQSPRKGGGGTTAKVKGTIPVANFNNPNKVKNVLVSMASDSSTDHTYAKEKHSIDTSSSEDSSSSSDDSVEDNKTSNNKQKQQQMLSASKGRGRPKKLEDTPTDIPPPQLRSILKNTPTPDTKVTFDKVKRRGRGCGNCAGCLREDCGNCCYCLDKPKFGGPGKKKQRCALRVCAHFVSHKSTPQTRQMLAKALVSDTTPKVPVLVTTPSTVPVSSPVKSLLQTPLQTPTTIAATPTSRGQVAATPTGRSTKQSTGAVQDELVKCVRCSRERKLSLSRSSKFCSTKCLKDWEAFNPGKSPDEAEPTDSNLNIPLLLQASMDKPVPRALKNLQINMALPGQRHHELTSSTMDLDITPIISSIDSGVTMDTTSPPVSAAGSKRSNQEEATPPKKSKLTATSPITSPGTTVQNSKQTRKGRASSCAPLLFRENGDFNDNLSTADVSLWSIGDVVKYFENTGECSHIAPVLREQEVDGEALLLLSHDSLVKCLGMKLGPALKVMTHVDKLKTQSSSSF